MLLPPPTIDPRDSARQAGLRYVTARASGYTRRRWGRGFTYLDKDGRRVEDHELIDRFQSLVIPPAWEEVWICRYPNGHIQATGRDERGRKQYIYHPAWEVVRNQKKFARMPAFAAALPDLRAQVRRDLTLPGYPRQKVLAILVRLLETTLIRIGNPEYARSNQSFGLTTLLDDHFEVRGSRLVFSFTGKSGKEQEVEVRDRSMARRVARLQELPGQRLFQYRDAGGKLQSIESQDVNEYLRQLCGQQFTAKDFRTWGGTVLAATELYRLGPVEGTARQKRAVSGVVKQVAAALHNTPAVCRSYYIHPAIFQAYADDCLFESFQNAALEDEQPDGLSLEERAVQQVLVAYTSTEN